MILKTFIKFWHLKEDICFNVYFILLFELKSAFKYFKTLFFITLNEISWLIIIYYFKLLNVWQIIRFFKFIVIFKTKVNVTNVLYNSLYFKQRHHKIILNHIIKTVANNISPNLKNLIYQLVSFQNWFIYYLETY